MLRIVSSFTDFYDGALGQATDESPVYVRETVAWYREPFEKEFNIKLSYDVPRHIGPLAAPGCVAVYFCGKLYRGFTTLQPNDHRGYFYTHESWVDHINRYAAESAPDGWFKQMATQLTYSSVSHEYRRAFTPVDVGLDLHRTMEAPIFLTDVRRNSQLEAMVVNPRLEDFNFGRHLLPGVAAQELIKYFNASR